jgi:hypothetical protein
VGQGIITCNDDNGCGCYPTMTQGTICAELNTTFCWDCSSDSDCPPGTYCGITGSLCCDGPTCIAPCGLTSISTNTPTPLSCPSGYELLNGACFEIAVDGGSNCFPECTAAYTSIDGTSNSLCGHLGFTTCQNTSECPSEQVCSRTANFCIQQCVRP